LHSFETWLFEMPLTPIGGTSTSGSMIFSTGRSRPKWPYLWLDATYLKVRDGGRIVSVAATTAVAVNTEGRREIVGLGVGPFEAEPLWSAFLKGLVKRGLGGGLRNAITRVLGATWQRCRVCIGCATPSARAQGPAHDGRPRAIPLCGKKSDLAARGRPVAPAPAQARCADGRQRA
jgi:hypothetical protein